VCVVRARSCRCEFVNVCMSVCARARAIVCDTETSSEPV